MSEAVADTREKILEIKDLCKWFQRGRGILDVIGRKEKTYLKAVDGITLTIYKGENMGLVGESGCGKSTLAKCLVRLYEPTDGQIILNGLDVTHLQGKELRRNQVHTQMIFQDPYSSLNPRMTVYEILSEMLLVHGKVPKDKVPDRVAELLTMSGLSMEIADRFPGEFSGGQRQRIGIARALSLEPAFIIADEPVSALDVSIQAQIINLLGELQKELNLTVLFISHDLNVVRHITQRVMVMYLGNCVELGPTEALFAAPLHPYTQVLAKAAPSFDPTERSNELAIEGDLPSPINTPPGCKFHPRCAHCQDVCRQDIPQLREISPGRFCACHFPLGGE